MSEHPGFESRIAGRSCLAHLALVPGELHVLLHHQGCSPSAAASRGLSAARSVSKVSREEARSLEFGLREFILK